MSRRQICYVNGRYVRGEEAVISPFDLSVLRGFAIFDYFRIYGGVAFELERYLARFARSLNLMQIRLAESLEQIAAIIHRLNEENGKGSFGVRLVATGGLTADGFSRPELGGLLVLFEPPPGPVIADSAGIKLIHCEYLRNFPEVKTTAYLNALAHRDQMAAAGAAEVLYSWKGSLLECSRSNFFLFIGNRLITADKSILNGVSRQVVLELARGHYELEVRPVAVAELREASEAFITGTSPKVSPVLSIDDQQIGDGRPGANTLNLRQRYFDYFCEYITSRGGSIG